ncbi:MAG: hypothetical protein RR623_10360 [Bacilli bacterium]
MKINLVKFSINIDSETLEPTYDWELSGEAKEQGAEEYHLLGIKQECDEFMDLFLGSIEESVENKKSCGIFEKAIIEKLNKGVGKNEDNKNIY